MSTVWYGKCENDNGCKEEGELGLVYVQMGGKSKPMWLCAKCRTEHEKILEMIRNNYEMQFGKNWH